MTGNCQVRFLEDGVGSNPTLLFDLSPILANKVLNGLEAELGRNFYSQKDGQINMKSCKSIKSTTPDLQMTVRHEGELMR